MNKIKICHLSSVHRALDTRVFLKECRSLSKFYQVTLIARHSIIEEIDAIKIIPFHNVKNRFIRILISPISMLILALKYRSDIYHIHDPELLFLVLPLRIIGAKVIYDSHEHLRGALHSKDYLNDFLIMILKIAFFTIERVILPNYNAIIVATPAIFKELNKFNKITSIINNYPLLSEFNEIKNWTKKRNCICYIGGITKIRGIFQILDSLDDIEVKLHLAGSFASSSLRDETKKHRNWNKIIEHGFVNREDMATIMRQSLAGLVIFSPLPNHVNAQPNKIFEYMSAGLPVIGSNFKLWRKIIVDNNCGICVNPEDSEELGQTIKYIIKNKMEAEQMGNNGRKAIEDKYNWEMEEIKLLQLYKGMI